MFHETSTLLKTVMKAIEALSVPAKAAFAAEVVVLGGLSGEAASSNEVRAAYEDYVNSSDNFLNVTFIPAANPDAEPLSFPPAEPAYGSNWTATMLWHWLSAHAPDVVIITGDDEAGLGTALDAGIAGLGNIASFRLEYQKQLKAALTGRKLFPESAAHTALLARSARSADTMAKGLAGVYGQELKALTYIPAVALIGRLQLGQVQQVEQIVASQLDTLESLKITSSLQIAGHLLFGELAERSKNPRYLALARRAADLGWDANGTMLEAMPFNGDYSDAFFMETPLLAKVGKLTGEQRYFDMGLKHVEFLQAKLLRGDGLYNHWPKAEAAWGRGNAFAALGLALALSDLPTQQPAHKRLLEIFRAHMNALLQHQDVDGMWHNVINMRESWPEFSATTMIATAIQRGVDRGWLDSFYQNAVDRAWEGVVARTDEMWGFIDVCESTVGQDSLTAYLNRKALSGRDDRAGGMLLLFATERPRQR